MQFLAAKRHFYSMRPVVIPPNIRLHLQPKAKLVKQVAGIRHSIMRLHAAVPEVSVIIPAFNEEGHILQTLSSLSATNTGRSVEIIVVDNNSTDATSALAALSGATCITAPVQGIAIARNAGLYIAKGKYILNADADTIYPPGWIDLMVKPLQNIHNAMVYGRFAFIPARGASRLFYFGYEYLADISRWINRMFREEAVNIYGFNSAFRRVDGLYVDGFNHPAGSNEDGWLGVKLRKAFGTLHRVTDARAMVWTSDRKIQAEGGLISAMIKRIKSVV